MKKVIDRERDIYLIKPFHVSGPITLSPDGKPIKDKFLMGKIVTHSEYFSNLKYEGLKAYVDHLERLIDVYVTRQLKSGTSMNEAVEIANLRYQKKFTRAKNNLNKYMKV
jgi:hypothetical protein